MIQWKKYQTLLKIYSHEINAIPLEHSTCTKKKKKRRWKGRYMEEVVGFNGEVVIKRW